MKKKIFTLLTLLLCVCSGAWADTEVIPKGSNKTVYSGTSITTSANMMTGNENGDYKKFRTNMDNPQWTITVKSGYIVTGISIKGYTNNTYEGATISILTLKANGTDILEVGDERVFPITTNPKTYATITKTGLHLTAGQTITCTFDNSNIISDQDDPNYNNAKNAQIMAKITITYEAAGPNLNGASSSPAASATSVALSGSGFLKFSKNLTSVTPANITISPSENGETLSSIAIDGTDASKVNYAWSGLQYNTEYTVNVAADAVSDGTTGNTATSLSFTTRPENFTVTYNVSAYKGTVSTIFANDVTTDDAYVLPSTNKYLSSDNQTQTGWSDGTNTYALGATIENVTSDITLTPVFTDNAGATMVKTLKGNDTDYNVTWNFSAPNAVLNVQGATGYLVNQATINGATVDIPIAVNATSGKLNNLDGLGNPRTDKWCQINNGTILSIPVVKNSVVSINSYGDPSGTTINSASFETTGSSGNYTATYTYTGDGGTIDFVADATISYISTINVTYPYDPSKEFIMGISNSLAPTDYFSITNSDGVTNAIGGSGSSGVYDLNWTNASSGYSYAIAAKSPSSSGKGKSSALTTRCSYTNITAIEVEVARDASDEKLTIEVSPNEDFSSSVTTVRAAATYGTSNREFVKITNNNLNCSGYVRVTFTSGGNSKTNAMTYLKVTATNATEIVTPAKNVTTYVTPQALDFTEVDGLKAYIATSKGTNTVNMTAVDAPVPAGTALLLKKTSDTSFNVPVVASATAPTTNYLKAGPVTFTGSENARYILKDGEFYLAAAGNLAAGKAYLDLTEFVAGARQLSIVFDDEETTGISNVDITKPEVKDNVYYNLNGQRVANPSKGLFIVNGKKVIIK